MANRIFSFLSKITNINENESAIQLKQRVIEPLGAVVLKLGLRPLPLNLLGLLLGLLTAFLIGFGELYFAFFVLLIAGLCDALDGFVARMLNIVSDFGVFFDSVCDRYVDTAILLGFAWYFMNQAKSLYVLLVFFTLVGTVVTSYARARAESLSLSSRYIGFMNRPERVIFLLAGLLFPQILFAIIWFLAITSNLTAIHRVLFYSREAFLRARQKSLNIIDTKDK
jgi:CDP-diacylglycerol--glycerol-3-phosphate 3-phosphatidyltransferase